MNVQRLENEIEEVVEKLSDLEDALENAKEAKKFAKAALGGLDVFTKIAKSLPVVGGIASVMNDGLQFIASLDKEVGDYLSVVRSFVTILRVTAEMPRLISNLTKHNAKDGRKLQKELDRLLPLLEQFVDKIKEKPPKKKGAVGRSISYVVSIHNKRVGMRGKLRFVGASHANIPLELV